jgi:SagB-type dehydrogenase family enzyme
MAAKPKARFARRSAMGKKNRSSRLRVEGKGPGARGRSRVAAPYAALPGGAKLDERYLADATRGQQLLERGQIGPAAEIFRAVLDRFGDTPSYERAAVLERLGICRHIGGHPGPAAAHLREAMAITETLAPSNGVKALRGALHSGLGDVLRATGELDDARRAYESAVEIAKELQDLRAQGLDLTHLGALGLVEGKPQEAEEHYRAALQVFQRIRERGLEALAWHQLGRAFQEMRRWDEAERHYREAARIRVERGDLAGAAQAWNQLAVTNRAAGDARAAEAWHRKAIDADRQIGSVNQLGRHLSDLAELLLQQGRLDQARKAAEEALAIGQAVASVPPHVWRNYSILADIADQEAATSPDGQRRAALQTEARNHRRLQQHAPRIVAALGRLGAAPSFGRAAILERLGRCFHLGGRPDLALRHFREAMSISERLAPNADVRRLRRMLHSSLGDTFRTTGTYSEAREAYERALKLAGDVSDLLGQASDMSHLGALALMEGRLEEARARYEAALQLLQPLDEPALEVLARNELARILQLMGQRDEADRHELAAAYLKESPDCAAAAGTVECTSDFEVALHDEVMAEYAFEPDLLLDGPRERSITSWRSRPDPLPDEARPMLGPCVRTCSDEHGAVWFCLPREEPVLERHPDCTVMRRARRDVVVSGVSSTLWRLLRKMDGGSTIAEILSVLPLAERALGARILAALAATGAIDTSGRTVGRFLHSATKKGVLPGGGLENAAVSQLAGEGSYRTYPGAPRLPVSRQVPTRLSSFHALSRERRSHREYLGLTVAREDFDALLHTACGVTGVVARAGREVKLRAYPSSGALYAVEIYPVVFRVEGLEPAVYHYHAVGNMLEVVRSGIDPADIVGAMLPVERRMVAGAAAMICLAGLFPRHERKYGEGGYRMLVAEAGHISQNLILAATALGLSARPFGGVFDSLLNDELAFDEANEQFLLAVLVGRATGGRAR